MKDPIDVISFKIADIIKRNDPDGHEDTRLLFITLSHTINAVATILLIMLIGYLTNAFIPTVISLVFFAVLRSLAKGYHLKSMTLCVFVTAALIAPLPHIPLPQNIIFLFTIFCMIIVLIKSKASLPKRIVASCIIGVGFVFIESYIALACAAQVVTLFPKGGDTYEVNKIFS